MNERKQKLLQNIIRAHVKTAQPVGSFLITEKYMKDVSSPTVRNEMRELEAEGLITHPYTSAGRIPTEKGYKAFLETIVPKGISDSYRREINSARRKSKNRVDQVKLIAKAVAELSDNASVVAFSANDVYYTGLSNLFAKPEFARQNIVVDMSQVIDHLDEVMSCLPKLFNSNTGCFSGEVSIFLGRDNPFADSCGSVLIQSKQGMVFGILGPMRMDYEKNIGLLKYVKGLLN